MKITAIKQQVKNPERVSVFLDGTYRFSLTIDQLLSEKLKRGAELDEAELKRLLKLSADGKLRMRVIEWLLGRPHSERELRDYLRRKQADTEFADELVLEMQRRKYQDDGVFARWFADMRRRRQKSDRFIMNELRAKGVSEDIIRDAVQEPEYSEADRLRAVYEKKKHVSRYHEREKMTRYLLSQGYSYDSIKALLEDA